MYKIQIAHLTFFFFFLNSYQIAFAQMGCSDPQAINYDATATINDGSCLYANTNYVLTQIQNLPDELEECSGLEWLSNGLFTHNDAGNEDKIYRIDSMTGEIEQSIIVATADNLDWEDLAESEDYLYIGDFGNNAGNRTNLRIYRIAKSDLGLNILNASLIEFSYEDQTDFSENNNNHDFDCEAFFYAQDSLHLFTKNWVDNQTRHYSLAAEPGTHIARFCESFDVGGLITSADISEEGEVLLLGYTELGGNFMWLLFDYAADQFFSGNRRKISLGNGFTNSQTEGITFRGNGYGYIGSERFSVGGQINLPPKLLAFSTRQWTNVLNAVTHPPLAIARLAPNPFVDFIEIRGATNLSWQLFSPQGQVLHTGQHSAKQISSIPTADLPSGWYTLVAHQKDQFHSWRLLKR